MLNVSAEWQKASRDQFRYQAYLQVKIEVVPPGLREGTVITATNGFAQAIPDTMMDGITDPPTAYATLEANRWLLDGNFSILPEDTQLTEWWANESEVATALHLVFDKPYTVPGIYFIWDLVSNSFPNTITVKGYDRTGTLKYNVTVNDIDSVAGFYNDFAMDDVQTIDIDIPSWSLETWRARVNEIVFGVVDTFTSKNNGRIASATQTSKAHPLSSSLPTHEFDLELRNIDKYFDPQLQVGVSKYLAQQQLVRVQWQFATSQNKVEVAPEQIYLAENFSIPSNSGNVQMHLTNRLALLNADFLKGTYTGSARSLYDIATYIFENSNILRSIDGQTPWTIPESFKTIMTTAPIPYGATNEILQLVALAGSSWLTLQADNGFVKFAIPEKLPQPDCFIDMPQELGDPEAEIKDRLKSITMGVYSYTPSAETADVGSGEYQIKGQQKVVIEYSVDYAQGVTASVSGATLTSATYYASYAELIITAPDAGATVNVKLTGTEVVQTVAYFTTFDDPKIQDGRKITIENPLITSVEVAQQVSDYAKPYYMRRNRYKMNYIGYPQLEASDKINITTKYGDQVAEVMENTVKFNGGWSGVVHVI